MTNRDKTIDILRGLAIFIMIGANMSAHSLEGDNRPFLFRLYGSLAAPLFILFAGMMLGYIAKFKSYHFGYYVKRAGVIFLVAVLIDILLWQSFSFSTDVLYMIGLATLSIYFFNHLNFSLQVGLVILIFVLTPLLQWQWQYNPEIYDPFASDNLVGILILRQFLIEGWFPIFPWLGLAFVGAILGSYRLTIDKEVFYRSLFKPGLILFVVGVISWLLFNPKLYLRDGYSELFYPPTLYYISTYLGLILMLMTVTEKISENKIGQLLMVYGRSSMLVYILHLFFIVALFNNLPAYSINNFFFFYLIHALVLWFICYQVQKIRNRDKWPFVLRMVVGG